MNQEPRGLRFPFGASAEVLVEGSVERVPARVTELSLRGCFLETSLQLAERQRVHVKIFYSDEFFESPADVLYVRLAGAGLVFGDMKPHFRGVLQRWILSALDSRTESKHP